MNIKTKNLREFFAIVIVTALLLTLSSCAFINKMIGKNDECEHKYTQTTVYSDCDSTGITTFTCSLCSDSYTEAAAPRGHTYSENVTAPTCEVEGNVIYTCSVCNKSYKETIAANGHSYTESTVNSDCINEGYTLHICSVCGDNYKDSYTPLLTHRFMGSDCVNCSSAQPREVIEIDTEWYDENVTVFVLKTKEQLAGLASLVNSGANFANKTIHMKNNIDLEFKQWTPIGNKDFAFDGTFDGDENTVSGLKINAATSYSGLFGNVSGVVKNFKISGATIFTEDYAEYIGIAAGFSKGSVSSVEVSGYLDVRECAYVGGVVGYTTAQTSVASSSAKIIGGSYVGGIAGYVATSSAVFAELNNTGSVTGGDYTGGIIGYVTANGIVLNDTLTNEANVSGKAYTGGIFGYIKANSGSNIKGSSSKGKIIGEYYVGGLIGRCDGVSVTDCSNEGTEVSATSCLISGTDFFAYLGGYVGYGTSVSGCINNSSIDYISRGSYVGGIAGYLTSGASDCENHGNISSGAGNVGGIVGSLVANANISLSSLQNTGDINGTYRTGGIMGYASSTGTFLMSGIENSGKISGTYDLGGIAGCVNYGITPGNVTASDLVNTGDVIGSSYTVGGLFGYIEGNSSSVVKSSSSSANVKGYNLVGGLVGNCHVPTLKDCSNEGSTITATGYNIEGEKTYACLGGYVGSGVSVSGCINKADIIYTSVGMYVGGIAGKATGAISDCENHGNISSTAGTVGGIVGYTTNSVTNCKNTGNVTSAGSIVGGIVGDSITPSGSFSYSNLSNSGNVSGVDYVAGIIGHLNQDTKNALLYKNEVRNVCSYDWNNHYNHFYYNITTMNNVTNTGSVNASGQYVGGILGYAYLNTSTANKSNIRQHCEWECYRNENYCNTYNEWFLQSSNVSNTGTISGTSNIGELFGYFSSDGASKITNYTVLDKVVISGEENNGAFDIGATKVNITLTDRTVYTPEVEDPENSEDETVTEDGGENTEENTDTEGSENNGEANS